MTLHTQIDALMMQIEMLVTGTKTRRQVADWAKTNETVGDKLDNRENYESVVSTLNCLKEIDTFIADGQYLYHIDDIQTLMLALLSLDS